MPVPDPPALVPARLHDLVRPGQLFLWGFAFWTGVAFVFAVQHALLGAHFGRPEPFHRVLIGEFASWWPLAFLTPPLVAVVLRFRRPGPPVFRTVALHAVGAVVFTVVAGALMGLSESLIPWGRQPDGPLAAAQWGVVGYLGPDLLLYVMIVAAAEASAYAWESRQRAVAVATYERQLVEARLHVLSAQLQPHFLFNALHAISALVWQDPARADRLLARLSEMLRLTLRSGTRVETTLAEEVTLLQRYAEIQEARYGDRLKVSFEVERRCARSAGAAPHPPASRGERDPPRRHPRGSRRDRWTCGPGRAKGACT